MAGLSYAFNVQQGETPETVARRRAVAEALLARSVGSAPQTIGEGLNSLGAAIGGRLAMGRAERSEAAGRAQGDAAFASLFGGGGMDMAAPAADPTLLAGGGGSDAMVGSGGGPFKLTYANQGKTRDLPISPDLASVYERAANAAGISEIRVSSGGQAAKGSGGKRTGSVRHDHGGAGDIHLIADGRMLDMTNPNDLPKIRRFMAEAHKLGAQGIGAGTDYMGNTTFHVGFGTPAVWGAGGRGANAPQWLREAVAGGGVPAVAQALSGGGGTGAMRGGPGGDMLTTPAAPVPPNPNMRPAMQPPAAAPRPMGTDPFTRRGPAFDRVANAGHDSLAPTGGVAAVAQALAPRPAPAPVAAPMPVQGGAAPATAPTMAAPGPAAVPPPQPGQTLAQPQGNARLNQLMQAAANPWLSETQRGLVTLMLKQEMDQADPATRLAIEKAQLEIEQMRNPPPRAPINAGNGQLYDPNTKEWISAPNAGAGFRPATPEEASKYGATGGQIGPDGRFYPINPPSGMTIESDGQGGFRMVQGSGVTGGKALTEAQSKDAVYATRATGALAALDPIDGELTSFWQRLAENDPTGAIRGNQSPEFQQAYNAGLEFLQAILRKDTGAAITAQEQVEYGRVYLPQPGDTPELLAQKRQARVRAVEALKAGMPPQAILNMETALQNSGSGGTPAAAPQAQPQGGGDIPLGTVIENDQGVRMKLTPQGWQRLATQPDASQRGAATDALRQGLR